MDIKRLNRECVCGGREGWGRQEETGRVGMEIILRALRVLRAV